MMYIDTNVIIAFIDDLDPNHSKAVDLLRSSKEDKVASKLTLIELASVYSRANLEDPLALAIYSVKYAGIRVVDINFNEVLIHAFKLAKLLRLRTLDLLHIATCKIMNAPRFATFDKDIISKSGLIERIGIEVVTK